jgi:hypothetical protein
MPAHQLFEESQRIARMGEPLIDVEFPTSEPRESSISGLGDSIDTTAQEMLMLARFRGGLGRVLLPQSTRSRGVRPFIDVANAESQYVNIGSHTGRQSELADERARQRESILREALAEYGGIERLMAEQLIDLRHETSEPPILRGNLSHVESPETSLRSVERTNDSRVVVIDGIEHQASSRTQIPFLGIFPGRASQENSESILANGERGAAFSARHFLLFTPSTQPPRNHETSSQTETCNERQIILESLHVDEIAQTEEAYERIQKLYDPVTLEAICHPRKLRGDATNQYFEFHTLMALKRDTGGYFTHPLTRKKFKNENIVDCAEEYAVLFDDIVNELSPLCQANCHS